MVKTQRGSPVMKTDRRNDWAARNNRMGLCKTCNAQALDGAGRCFRHWIIYRLQRAGLTKGILSKANKVRRENFIASMRGRYEAVRAGHLQPSGDLEALHHAAALRARLLITWGGVRGLRKTATLLRLVERKALS